MFAALNHRIKLSVQMLAALCALTCWAHGANALSQNERLDIEPVRAVAPSTIQSNTTRVGRRFSALTTSSKSLPTDRSGNSTPTNTPKRAEAGVASGNVLGSGSFY